MAVNSCQMFEKQLTQNRLSAKDAKKSGRD